MTAGHLPVMTEFLADLAEAADHASDRQQRGPGRAPAADHGSYN